MALNNSLEGLFERTQAEVAQGHKCDSDKDDEGDLITSNFHVIRLALCYLFVGPLHSVKIYHFSLTKI